MAQSGNQSLLGKLGMAKHKAPVARCALATHLSNSGVDMTSFAATCLTALVTLSAVGATQAATFSGPISVSLISPGGFTTDGVNITPDPLSFTQSLTPPVGAITPAGGGDIGGFMLPPEFIKLNGTSIVVRTAEGASNGTTGYLGSGGQHARYQFGGLSIAGQVITGLTYTLTDTAAPPIGTPGGIGTYIGVDNVSALSSAKFVRLDSPTSFEVDLDQIHFKDRGAGESNNFVDISISFTTAAVPEPSSAALALVGLAAVAGLRARRRARASA
jgi:MYXO-CTERM domain-containing protein